MLGAIIKAIMVGVAGAVAVTIVDSVLQGTGLSYASSSEKAVLDTLPVVIGVVGFAGMFASLTTREVVERMKKWRDFGERLKVAYEAKYGYRNTAFDEEVDRHVLVMRAITGGRYSKSLSETWLKRVAHMVEVSYAIPEEEEMSEEDKTEMLAEEAGWRKSEHYSAGSGVVKK
jgi:hypothetical protein